MVCWVPGTLSLGCSFATLSAAHREMHSRLQPQKQVTNQRVGAQSPEDHQLSKPIRQFTQRPKLPFWPGRSGHLLALPIDPGHRNVVRNGRHDVVKIALRRVEPALGGDPAPRGGEVTWRRLVRADLLGGDE